MIIPYLLIHKSILFHAMKHFTFILLACFIGFAKQPANAQTESYTKVFYDMGGTVQVWGMAHTADQNFLLAGERNNQPVIIKIDQNGNILWQKRFDLPNARSADQTPDGGYIITGSIAGASPYNEALYLLKLNSSGDPEWFKQQSFPSGDIYSQGLDVVAQDDGFIVSAILSNEGTGLIKSDFTGNVLWAYSYPYAWMPTLYYTLPGPKLGMNALGGYNIVSGFEFGPGMFIITDGSGASNGSKMLINIPLAILQTPDGGNLIASNGPIMGVGMSPTDNLQLGLIKTDSAGSSSECVFDEGIWRKPVSVVFSSPALESFSGGTIAPIHPAIVSGIDLEVVNSCVTVTGSLSENGKSDNPLQIYPNPSNGSFNINFAHPTTTIEGLLEVYNFSGTLVHRDNILGELPLAQSMKFLPGGLYNIRLYTGNGVYYQRIMIIHP